MPFAATWIASRRNPRKRGKSKSSGEEPMSDSCDGEKDDRSGVYVLASRVCFSEKVKDSSPLSLPCQATATMSDLRRGDAPSCRFFSPVTSRSRR